MSEEDKLEIIRLVELKSFNPHDKHSAQDIIQRYIDAGAKYCMSCDGAVRSMFRRLRSWWEEKGGEYV